MASKAISPLSYPITRSAKVAKKLSQTPPRAQNPEIPSETEVTLVETVSENESKSQEGSSDKKNEDELGEIFTFFVLETILLSRLMNINPFSQPAVEQVKIEARKLLR